MKITNTRPRPLLGLAALALTLAAVILAPNVNAETLVDITFGPQGGADNGTDYGVLGTTSAGILDTTTVNGLQSVATASTAIPANDNSGVTTVGSTVYSFSVSGLTVDGDPGHTLTFDMSLTAGSTEPKPYITVNGGPNRGWVGLSQNTTRFEENETLTFVVSNVLLDGGAGATFTGFTGFVSDVSQNVTQGASASDTYLLQGDGSGAGGSRLRTIDFGFSTTASAAIADAATSTVEASPATVANDGVATSTITVTLKDVGSNPVFGKTVTLASDRGATDTISAASGPSNASGVVTFAVSSSTAGSPVFTATDTTDGVVVTDTATVTFTASGVASAANSTVAASPAAVAADGATTSTITVTLKDGASNPVAGNPVTLASDRGATDTISAASGPSNAAGVVTFTVTSNTGGNAVFTATDTTDSVVVAQTATVTFMAPPAIDGNSTVAADRSSVFADGASASTITVTLNDADGIPVAGNTVTLASDRGATDSISAASGPSDASGEVTFTVTSTAPGDAIFTATDTTDVGVLTQTATVSFIDLSTAVLITFGPQGFGGAPENLTDYGVLGTTSAGTFDTTTVNGLQSVATASPAVPANAFDTSTVASTVYGFSVSDITVDGSPGHTLTWNMTMTAGSTMGSPFLSADGGPNRGWVVTSQNSTRFETNETLTYVISDVLFDGGAGATFTGFTGAVSDIGGAMTEDTSTPGTFVVGGTGFGGGANRVRSVSFGFSIGSSSPFAITEIDYNPDSGEVTLTWNSRPGMTYIARYSGDMTNWGADMGDSLTAVDDERPDDGDFITETFDLTEYGLQNLGDLFFRIDEAE